MFLDSLELEDAIVDEIVTELSESSPSDFYNKAAKLLGRSHPLLKEYELYHFSD